MPIKIGNTTVIDDSRGAVFNSLKNDNGLYIGSFTTTPVVLSSVSNIDCSLGNYFQINNLLANVNFINVPQVGLYAITLDIVNSTTVTFVWPAGVSWVSSSLDRIDSIPTRHIVNMYTVDGGASWIASLQLYGVTP